MSVNRWMIVASWWERLIANAAASTVILAVLAWLAFPPFATTQGWPFKVLAMLGLGLASGAANEVPVAPVVRTYRQPLTGLDREQRTQVLKALRGKAIPLQPDVLAAAIYVGAIGQAYQQRYTNQQKTWRFVLPVLYVALAALQLIGRTDTRHTHQALMWLMLAAYFGVYFIWTARRGRQLDHAVSRLREAAVDVPLAATAAAQTTRPAEVPPRQIWRSLIMVAVIGIGFGAAIWAWGEPFPSQRDSNCRIAREMSEFDSAHIKLHEAWLATGSPALSEYEQWSQGLQHFATQVSGSPFADHVKKVGDLSVQAVAVVRDLHGVPGAPSPSVITAHQNDYLTTLSTLLDEETQALKTCADS